jgi:outer membrane protein W
MKKLFSFVLVVCAVLLISSVAYCQEESLLLKRLGVGVYGVYTEQKVDNYDSCFAPGGYIRYMPMDNLAFETSFDVQSWDFDTVVSGATGNLTGDFTVMPLSLTALLTYPLYEGKFHPYVGGGLDILFIDNDVSGTLTPGGVSTVEYDTGVGGHVSTGADWMLNENFVLNLDMKYTWCSPDVSTTTSEAGTTLNVSDDPFDNLALRMGLAYYF